MHWLQMKRGARSPNLQVVITHASHVCSQNAQNAIWPRAFQLSTPHNLITHACFDHLSHETHAKHSTGAKAFGPLIVVVLHSLTVIPYLKNINVAYIPVGLVANSSKKSSQMTCASCMSNLSPFLSATKPLRIYLDSVGKNCTVLVLDALQKLENCIKQWLIDNFNFLSVWFSRDWK